MNERRYAHSIDDIKHMLLAQVDRVAQTYAPAAPGSYTDKGKYFTLNPGRVDRNVGSFYVNLSGPYAGRFQDHATGQGGDLLDLIQLHLNCDLAGALREARAFLGLETVDPATRAQRERAAAEAKAHRAQAERDERERADRRARQAKALWLSGVDGIEGTPVGQYLRERRGIDLARLPRRIRVLRYLRDCFYSHTDPETGEVIEGSYPAMVAPVVDARGRVVACHRTYLALGHDGRWDKAPVPKAKKVLGMYGAGAIHVWRGNHPGPRGGQPPSLKDAPHGTRVFIAEGIEDALSCALVVPEHRVLAAISLGNLANVVLPPAVTRVTLIADRDEGEQAQKQLERARRAFLDQGRAVAVWQNGQGGKDLNDALRAAGAGGVVAMGEGAA
ncbi:DUF7146 domain-containing protein [Palleronia pelagia]|uniref:Toprim domain-containing protein n=1 Tax=Palleronia pelagia TaxID=387096 RepID=A0A1H8HXM2_9RHOB|nr:toprim domain-containing protein [Palleronia pelagia]SEN60787.1 Toprim domain-containing protein [Palleronia pelagia]